MKAYVISWNNNEHPDEYFSTYKEAEAKGIEIGGQWAITEKEHEWLKI